MKCAYEPCPNEAPLGRKYCNDRCNDAAYRARNRDKIKALSEAYNEARTARRRAETGNPHMTKRELEIAKSTPSYIKRIKACLATDGSHRLITQVIPVPKPPKPRLVIWLAEEAQMELI
jgi:hypothetical protein